MMKKWITVASLVTMGLIASYHGLRPDQLFTKDNTDTATQMNFYLSHLESRTFNETGHLTQTLLTEKASQNAAEKTIILGPLKITTGDGNNRWHMSALSGKTDPSLQKITLENTVKLSRIDGSAEVQTEMLTLDAESETAYTDLSVTILLNGSITSATGLHVDMKQETIHLKNNVKTYYDPETNRLNNSRSNG